MAAMSDGDNAARHPNNDEEAKEIERILSKVDSTTFGEDDWNDVVKEAESLAVEWEKISRDLGLSSSDINRIKCDFGRCGCYKCWSEALDHWIKQNYNTKRYGEPSWRTLLKAIARVNKLRFKKLAKDHQGAAQKTETGFIKPSLTFPYLKLEKASKAEEEKIHQRLYSESETMNNKFKDLFKSTRQSLIEQNISVIDLLEHLDCSLIGYVQPIFKGSTLPVLGCQLPELRKLEKVKDAMSVISSYCSFFNYRIVEEIINNLGTEQDKTNLKNYQEEFRVYAQRHIFECPSELGEMSEIGHANMFVTLDVMYESYTVSHLYAFVSNLQRVLKVPAMSLRLCRIGPGSLKIIFQLPYSVQQSIFPLSSDQEKALSDLGVVLLSCGDYQFTRHEVEDPTAIDGDLNHRDPESDSDGGVFSNNSCTPSDNAIHESYLGAIPSVHVAKDNGSSSVCDSGRGTSSSVTTDHETNNQEITDPNIGMGQGSKKIGHLDENELHLESRRGDVEKVKRLVEEKKLDPLKEVGKRNSMNALHYAAEGGDLDVMKYFVEEKGYNPSSQDSEGLTCLHYAAQYNHFNLVQYFVGIKKIDPMCEGSTPLHSACVGGSASIVEYLVNAMTEYLPIEEVIKCKGKKGWSPLHFAAFYGQFEIIILLITKFNANPLMVDDDDRIALHGAAQQGYLEIVKVLVEHNCNPSCADKANMTPLHFAAWKGHLDIVKYLTQEQRCDPSCLTASQQTPLHGAAWNGHLDVVKYLTLDPRCDPLCKTKNNLTPYHWAARKGQLDIVKFYIENLRCPPDFKGGRNNKRTSLDMARDEKHHGIVKYLKSIRRNPKK